MKIYFPGNKKVYADYRGFTIQTDQPAQAGGDGSAPAPFDLFLASIGTCAGIYVLGFCQQRNIPTHDITLELKSSSDQKNHLIDHIAIDIHLPSGFPTQYAAAVKKSASLCAVKRHLQNPPNIDIRTLTNE